MPPKCYLQDALNKVADYKQGTTDTHKCVVVECRNGSRLLVVENRSMLGDNEGDHLSNYDDDLKAIGQDDGAFDIMTITIVNIGFAVPYIMGQLRDKPHPSWIRKK